MSLSAKFDPSSLNIAFDKMRKDARAQGKPLAMQNANFFVRMAKKIAKEDSTPTVQEMESKRSLGFRLKIKDPRITTVQGWYKRSLKDRKQIIDEEIARRIRARGTFAKGWRFWKFEDSGDVIRIWVKNSVGYAEKINERDHTGEKAAVFVAKLFQRKLNSLSDKLTRNFGK